MKMRLLIIAALLLCSVPFAAAACNVSAIITLPGPRGPVVEPVAADLTGLPNTDPRIARIDRAPGAGITNYNWGVGVCDAGTEPGRTLVRMVEVLPDPGSCYQQRTGVFYACSRFHLPSGEVRAGRIEGFGGEGPAWLIIRPLPHDPSAAQPADGMLPQFEMVD